jgi:thiamine-phosphate pyrophosphorylase
MLRYAITGRTQYRGDEPARHGALLQQAAHLASANIDYLQLREKDLPAATLAALAREILAILRAHDAPTKLLINSRPDIALATRSHGVHLTSALGALTPTQVRALYAHANLPTPTISLSCHTLEEVSQAAALPEDARPALILFGPVFEKRVATTTQTPKSALPQNKSAETLPGTGLTLLAAACHAAAPIPVLALGGITEQNTPSCLAAGAAGVAAIRLFLTDQ